MAIDGLARWLLLCCLGSMAAAALPPPVEAARQAAGLPESALGLVVWPLAGGPPRLEHRADAAMNPASAMKLITGLAALERLGPAYSWRTTLYGDGPIVAGTLEGNLYLQGGGDPRFTFEQLWLLLRQLRARGVQRIAGDLVLDRSRYRLSADPAANFDEQPERAYHVDGDALLVNFKAQKFEFESDDGQVTVRVEPPLDGLQVSSRQQLVDLPCERWPTLWQRPEIRRDSAGIALEFIGEFPRHCRAERYLALFDHADFAGRLTLALWRELGGSVAGTVRQGPVPEAARQLGEWESAELGSQLRDLLKFSNNTMARAFYLSLGADLQAIDPDAAGFDTAAAAERAVQAALASLGLDFPELVVENGSGLSRLGRVSPRHLAELLRVARAHRYGDDFYAALPVLGVDGTLRRRLDGTPLAGQGRLKTGTLDEVRALAGLMHDATGRPWIVVALVNDPRAEASMPLLDALLRWVWTLSDQDPPSHPG
ncbi:D-alanyl-D-alanine carboxypeptidase/D-alanyl-D-alanine endopeptidase [Chitinimonas lacunae]|uniref:D-alanyl-D-alanine carboxypeptidase/D-alanyl-D-alanine-endopeptidase n=1 Tax=Chitinimonas lacunae TaxID=1963018 RepID=A0ABV8MWX8_9NEIS